MRRTLLLPLATLAAIATPLFAHTALVSSSPGKDETLATSPSELRLTFNERIDPRLASLRLIAEDGEAVALGELGSGDSAQVIVARVPARLAPGTYTVAWQVVGADGHAVRGSYTFATMPGPDDGADTASVADRDRGETDGLTPVDPETQAPVGAGSSVSSPAYVAVRWLTYTALVVAIGAVGFRWIVLGGLGRTSIAADALVAPAAVRAATIGRGALVFLVLAAGARLLTQLAVIAPPGTAGSPAGNGELVRALLLGTAWGWGWLLQVAAAVAGIGVFEAIRRRPAGGWRIAAVLALILAVTPALSGHAVAVPSLTGLAVAVDSVHVLAVSAWLGTLLFVVGVGMPEAIRADPATSITAIAGMVRIFSPAALVLAGVAAGTGVVSATFQMTALSDLWLSEYGRMLLLKLAAVLLVVAAGAYNWLRLKPRLSNADDPVTLRTSGALELGAAALVLLLTAILVATPTP